MAASNSALVLPARRIIIIDDDALFRESLEQNLADAGFEILAFENGLLALSYFANGGGGDLILLDWKMPDLNGIEVLRLLRQDDIQIPVIFLTVLNDQIYEEAALMGGAVDFVEKSRSFSILLRRIGLTLSGARGDNDEVGDRGGAAQDIDLGDLNLDVTSNRAIWRGRRVDLSLTEFQIVGYLAARPDKDVGYRELYDLVHGVGFFAGEGEQGYRANVRTFVKRIRQKFRNVDPAFEQIENYPGFGYRWRHEDRA